MNAPTPRKFYSLGFSETANGLWDRPDRLRFFDNLPKYPTIARGAGLSLCGASFGDNVSSVDMQKFNRILSFDDINGIITVEAGASLGKLYKFLAPRGWMVPVQPGYPDITIGGCIAANVHGKNPLNMVVLDNGFKKSN